jgi:GDP-mannose 6-dehydrogenase
MPTKAKRKANPVVLPAAHLGIIKTPRVLSEAAWPMPKRDGLRISIFGLGYVGTVCAACLAKRGHHVVGVDKSAAKIEALRVGESPIVEATLDILVRDTVKSGHLRVTFDEIEAIHNTDLSLICVGTPNQRNGCLNLAAVSEIASTIGQAIRNKKTRHTIVVRSTVIPGTIRRVVVPLITKASGGTAFNLACNPEFMRESSAVADFEEPSKIVIGTMEEEVSATVLELYKGLPGARIVTDIESAEFIKYVDNAWHALKVAFANEIGVIAKESGIDSRNVLDMFAQDKRLNISPAYLKPGFAFGGSCLPKDLRALTYFSQTLGLTLPVLDHILDSNRKLVERGVNWILTHSKQRIALLGISFKSGTDDLRESPFVELAERLIGKGREIRIFDPNVHLSDLIGANKEYIHSVLPHIRELLVSDIGLALNWADTIVVTTADPSYLAAVAKARPDQNVLDFSGTNVADVVSRSDGFLW